MKLTVRAPWERPNNAMQHCASLLRTSTEPAAAHEKSTKVGSKEKRTRKQAKDLKKRDNAQWCNQTLFGIFRPAQGSHTTIIISNNIEPITSRPADDPHVLTSCQSYASTTGQPPVQSCQSVSAPPFHLASLRCEGVGLLGCAMKAFQATSAGPEHGSWMAGLTESGSGSGSGPLQIGRAHV